MNLIKKLVFLEREAAEFGFEWETSEQIMQQIHSECQEVSEHLSSDIAESSHFLKEEIGDLMHAVFSLCVFCGLDPQATLQQAVDKFDKRLQAVKAIAAHQKLNNLKGKNFEELMVIWKKAKEKVG